MRMKIGTWEQKQMAACKTYEELETIVRRTNIKPHFEIPDSIHHSKTSFKIDHTAFLPSRCTSGSCSMQVPW